MKVFNLTDRQHPDGRPCRPKNVLIAGKVIPPGESVEFSPSFNAGGISGLCRRGVVSLMIVPSWYELAKTHVKKPELIDPPQETKFGIESVLSVNAIDVEAEEKPRKKKSKK